MVLVENKIIFTKEEAKEMIVDLKAQHTIGVDTETTGFNSWEHSIIGFCFASPEIGYYLPTGQQLSGHEVIEIATEVLKLPNEKVFHNGKFDIAFINELDIPIEGKIHDTMIEAHLLDENRKSKKLKDLAVEYIDKSAAEDAKILKAYFTKNKLDNYGQIPIEIIGPYGGKDPWFTLILHNDHFYPGIQKDFQDVYDNEMNLLLHLTAMEKAGVTVDVKYLESFQEDCEKRILEVQNEIYKLAGHTFNVNSGDELAVVLFSEMGLPIKDVSAKTGKPCIDKYTLLNLKGKHEIVDLLLEYRGLAKLASTYIKGVLNKVVEGNKIHADFQQVGTTTGRLSCWSPNLHNIPRGPLIRKAFLNPEPGKTQLLFYDYSQIEFRMVAHYAKDPVMIKGFMEGYDFHTWTGMKLFGLPAEELTKEHRIKAKQINFGIVYGMGKKTLASKLGVNEAEAAKFLNDYYNSFPMLRPFIGAVKYAVRSRKFIKNFTGRKRRLHSAESYKGVNALAQGSAADILKVAMAKVGDYLRTKESCMIMNIHDEVILVHYLNEPEIISEVKRIMEDFDFRVPIVVDVERSTTNWGEKEELCLKTA